MKKSTIKKNYLYNLMYQMLVLLTPFITTPYLSRILEPDGVGIASYISSIESYFCLFATLGLTTFGQREISYVQDNPKERTQIFWEVVSIQFCSSIVAIFVYIIYSLNQTNKSLFLVLVFNLFSTMINVTWFFQGIEQFQKIVLRNTICKLIGIAYVFLVIHNKEDLILYMAGTVVMDFISNISLWFYLPMYISNPLTCTIRPWRHLKSVISLFIPTIAIQIYTVLDKTMVGAITKNSFENGYYEQAMKISKMGLSFVTSLGTVMIPRIGYYFNRGEKETVKYYMYKAYRFVWFLGIPLCFGLIGICGNFVPWFLGEKFSCVVPILSILAFLVLSIGINNVTGVQYLIPTKRQNIFTITVVVGAIVNFLMNLVFIYYLKSIGAALASVIAETLIAVIQLFIIRKELSTTIIIKSAWNYLCAGIIMLIAIKLTDRFLCPSFMHTILMILEGATIYFSILLLLKDDFFIDNIKQLVRVFLKLIRKG